MAATPASSRYSRWSADKAPNSAASAAPPWLESCSAWSFTGRPSACAVDRIGQSLAVHRRQLGQADLVDVALLVVAGFGRQGVGAQERGHDPDRSLCA